VKIFALILRGFFALLLIVSALGKLLDMPGFFAIVATYQTLPTALIPAAAWSLTLVELALGVWVAAGVSMPRAALAVIALHVMYSVWLTTALMRGLNIPNCGCFGVFWPRPLTAQTLVEDSALLVLAVALWMLHKNHRATSSVDAAT
jgi:uncharacterized membrane protein YphA (DoxX/SURF4 family)